MNNVEKVSSGINILDQLIDYLYIGDNVVWEVESGMKHEVFLEAFMENSFKELQPVVYISFNSSPQTVLKRAEALKKENLAPDFFLIDCFSSGKGRKDTTFMSFYEGSTPEGVVMINNNSNPDELVEVLKKCDKHKSSGCRYIFDSITGMQETWKDPAVVLDFFTYMCPRLFDLNTIAYWTLEKNAHTESFRANVRHITQVVLELFREGESFVLQPLKLSRRKSIRHFRKVIFSIDGGSVNIIDIKRDQKVSIGGMIREIRSIKGISQKAFAEKIDMTPSYISQIESNQLLPSLPAFMDICRELQVDPNTLLKGQSADEPDFITRKQETLEKAVRETPEYSVFEVSPGSPGKPGQAAWLLELGGTVNSIELLDLLGSAALGLFVVDSTIEVSPESGGELYASEGDFLLLDTENPCKLSSLHDKSSALVLGGTPRT